MIKITENWFNMLKDEFNKPYFISLQKFLDNEYKKLYVWNHDMANHLLALSLLAEQEKYDQALSYMKQMQEKGDEL